MTNTFEKNLKHSLLILSSIQLDLCDMLDLYIKIEFWYTKTFWLGLVMVLVFYSPYIIQGQDSVWYANDYLELVVHWFKLLIDQQAILKSNDYPITGMLDVLPRGSFASEFYLKTWLFYFFTPFQAILVNKLLIHLIGYVSAYHFLSKISSDWIQGPLFLYALFWACIPFWPEAGIGLAFTPSVFWVFYKLAQGRRINWTVIILILGFCFYSYLHLNGIFLIIGLFAYGLLDFAKKRDIYFHYWLALGLLTITYLLFSYRIFDIYFFNRDWFTPHRVEYDIYSFGRYHKNVVDKLKHILLFGEIHAILISPILCFTIAGYLIFPKYFETDTRKYIFLLRAFIGIIIIALVAALLTYIPLIEGVPIIEKINQFSFERFNYLIYPVMIFSFILIVDQMILSKRLRRYGWILITALMVYNFLVLDDNMKNKVLKPLLGIGVKYPTFRQFYAESQFAEIKNYLEDINRDNIKVANLGFHPAIASYNGLHAIDGYTGNYPLTYKNKIFDVISEELGSSDRGNWLYWHFKGWGNKAYLFNQTHYDDFMRLKWFDEEPIISPKYNYDKLKELGCNYILSADPVVDELNLTFLKKFEDQNSAWNIFLYKVK